MGEASHYVRVQSGDGEIYVDLAEARIWMVRPLVSPEVHPERWLKTLPPQEFPESDRYVYRFLFATRDGRYVLQGAYEDRWKAGKPVFHHCLVSRRTALDVLLDSGLVRDIDELPDDLRGLLTGQRSPDSAAEERVSLTESQRNILDAALMLGATDEASRKSQDEIAIKAGVVPDVGNTGATFRELVRRGFLTSKTGRTGGTWLTEKGRTIAR